MILVVVWNKFSCNNNYIFQLSIRSNPHGALIMRLDAGSEDDVEILWRNMEDERMEYDMSVAFNTYKWI